MNSLDRMGNPVSGQRELQTSWTIIDFLILIENSLFVRRMTDRATKNERILIYLHNLLSDFMIIMNKLIAKAKHYTAIDSLYLLLVG